MRQSFQYLLNRLLGKEFYTYSSEESLNELKDKLSNVFESRWIEVDPGLYGGFVTEYEFSVSRKSIFAFTQEARTRIDGLVYIDNDRTYVDLVVRPAPQLFAFVLFFVLLATIMAGVWIYYDVGNFVGVTLNALGVMFFSTILVGFVGMVLKDVLRWKFVSLLRLRLERK
jgi:hypothetical protein